MKLKTYIVKSRTNYGVMVHIVNAKNEVEGKEIAKENGAWDDCAIEEVDSQTPGVTYVAAA